MERVHSPAVQTGFVRVCNFPLPPFVTVVPPPLLFLLSFSLSLSVFSRGEVCFVEFCHLLPLSAWLLDLEPVTTNRKISFPRKCHHPPHILLVCWGGTPDCRPLGSAYLVTSRGVSPSGCDQSEPFDLAGRRAFVTRKGVLGVQREK